MSTTLHENKELVRRFVDAVNNQQLDLLDAMVASDVVRHCQATPEVDVRSLEDFKDFLRADLAAFPDSTQSLRHLVAEGDFVAVWATYTGTQRGQMGPFPPSGRRMQVEFGAMLRIAGGRIAELWITWDNMAALAQLGHLPGGLGQSA
jgi:steroid delta-isomerase-like uncharacterized protein